MEPDSKKAYSMCSIHCIPEMPRHKDKGDREYIKEKKIQKGQKRIFDVDFFAI